MELSEARKIVSNEISNICDKELSEAWYKIESVLDNCEKVSNELTNIQNMLSGV